MPLYRCTVSKGLAGYEQRARIAEDVTRIHCDVTGAPAKFVHTFFAEDENDELPGGTRAVVFGSIRAGRTEAQKHQLVREMTGAIATTLGVAPPQVMVVTVDVPARWVMEGGAIMPEPGEEADWLAKHG